MCALYAVYQYMRHPKWSIFVLHINTQAQKMFIFVMYIKTQTKKYFVLYKPQNAQISWISNMNEIGLIFCYVWRFFVFYDWDDLMCDIWWHCPFYHIFYWSYPAVNISDFERILKGTCKKSLRVFNVFNANWCKIPVIFLCSVV